MNDKNHSLQKRIINLTLLAILLSSIVCALFLGIMLYSNNQYNVALSNLFNYTTLAHDLNQAHTEFNSFIQSNSQETITKYRENIANSKQNLSRIINGTTDESIYYQLIGIEKIIGNYEEKNNEICGLLKTTSLSKIYDKVTESQTLYEYITIRLSSVTKDQNLISSSTIESISSTTQSMITAMLIVLIGAFCFLLVFSLNISRKISTPIIELTNYAKDISEGHFNSKDSRIEYSLELKSLSESLNIMKKRIKEMFIDLEDKTQIETKLHEAEIYNLTIKNELKSTELQMLQAQINPHFLFNTLNSIARLAYLNNNPEIESLIQSLSDLLRYNLNCMNKPITLQEEIDNLEKYILIQQTRFQGKLLININTDSKHLDLPMPALILQPLVENSIDHGLKPLDYDGTITIDITDSENEVIVKISDTGIGMDSQLIAKIMSNESNETTSDRHSGIGLANVLKRIQHFYGNDNCLEITSTLGEGTTITLHLNQEQKNDQIFDM